MILQDRKEREKGIAKNAVEAYVYEMRGKLCSQLEKFITEEVLLGSFSFGLKEGNRAQCFLSRLRRVVSNFGETQKSGLNMRGRAWLQREASVLSQACPYSN